MGIVCFFDDTKLFIKISRLFRKTHDAPFTYLLLARYTPIKITNAPIN